MPVFGIVCIDLRRPPQKCLPLFSIYVLVCPLGVPLLCCQDPLIRGIGHLNGRVPQRHEPRGICPLGGDDPIVLLLLSLSSVCELLIAPV